MEANLSLVGFQRNILKQKEDDEQVEPKAKEMTLTDESKAPNMFHSTLSVNIIRFEVAG